MALEEESVEHVTRIHELEESDRQLRDRMEGSISAEEAKLLRVKVSEQEAEQSRGDSLGSLAVGTPYSSTTSRTV